MKDRLKEFEGVWPALGKPYPFKFFKGCLPQILLGPFLNTLTYLISPAVQFTLICVIILVKCQNMFTFAREGLYSTLREVKIFRG